MQNLLSLLPALGVIVGLYVVWNYVIAPRLDDEQYEIYRRDAGVAASMIIAVVLVGTMTVIR